MKTLSMAILLGMAFLCTHQKIEAGDKVNTRSENKLINYTWYYDPDYTDAVGVVNSLNAELARLRSTYTSNVFSATPAIGLVEYEWGYFNILTTTIIYSDK